MPVLRAELAFIEADHRVSERRARKLLDMGPSGYRISHIPNRNAELRENLVKLARGAATLC